jgi:class 3 adenylate cyclase
VGTSGLVTILFTDLVGSTALSQDVGDEVADDLRRDHFQVLRQAIGRTGGSEVKTIGDALMVSYPGAADAVAGAVAMQQGVDLHNRRSDGPRLEMRVGISAGDASFEDDDWFGTPVVEAARLCSAADGGQILVADIVRVLAGSRAGHEMRLVDEVEAKGLPEPITACEVVWLPESGDATDEADTLPLPPAIDQVDTFSFVGRELERETLVATWKEVAAGDRRVVLLAGEPGIGKTRTVKEVCRLAHDQGGLVLWGGCEEDLGIPYQPFAEALRWYANAASTEALQGALGLLGGELLRLVPDLAGLVPGLEQPVSADPDTERYRLFESIVELLGSLSERSPVVLVLDDVHWAAKPTLLMLRHLLRGTGTMRLLVVATYRDTDLDRTHPLSEMLADLRRQDGVERLSLTGLDEQGVADFMTRTAGHDLDEQGIELARAVHLETEGNPFFVGEVLLHLSESGALVFRDGRWVSDFTLDEIGIPEGVREVVGRRLSNLAPEVNELLTLASVVGREFDVNLLTDAADVDQEAVLDSLEAAERHGLVEAVSGRATQYRFAHALVRTTLYDELTTSGRLRLHRSVARALARRPDASARLPELARHFSECAALGEIDRAVDYCRRAGDAASAELAFEEAAGYYERALGALDLADDVDLALRADLLRDAGAALKAIADRRGGEVLAASAEVARELDDPVRLADAALALHGNIQGTDALTGDSSTVALLEEAIDGVPSDDRARAALLRSALMAQIAFTPQRDRRIRLAGEALSLARQIDDPRVLARVLSEQVFGYDHTAAEIVERYAVEAAESIDLAHAIGDPVVLCRAYFHRILGSIMTGDRTTLDADLDAVGQLTATLRQPIFEFRFRTLHAARALLSGSLAQAEQEIADIAEFGERHQLAPGGIVGTLSYRLYYERGRLAELEPLVAQMVVDQPAIVAWRTAMLGIYSTNDRYDDAREHLHTMAADDFAMVPRDNLWVVTMAGIARVAGLVGELEIAEAAFDYMVPFHGIIAGTGQSAEQPVALSIGTAASALGRYDEAEALFAEAIELCERLGAPTFVAATEVQWAQTLLERGRPADKERALTMARRAAITADELGLGRVAELSRRVLG